jgi:hypothetical protein
MVVLPTTIAPATILDPSPTQPNSLRLFPVGGNYCDKFRGGAATVGRRVASPTNSLHLLPPGGNYCDKFRGGAGVRR